MAATSRSALALATGSFSAVAFLLVAGGLRRVVGQGRLRSGSHVWLSSGRDKRGAGGRRFPPALHRTRLPHDLQRPPGLGPEDPASAPQIQDLVTDNIAGLGRAGPRHLRDVIPLWFGEGRRGGRRRSSATRPSVALGRRPHLLRADHARQPGADGGAVPPTRPGCTAGPFGAGTAAPWTPGGDAGGGRWRSAWCWKAAPTPSISRRNGPTFPNAIHVAGAEARPCPLMLQDNRWTLDVGRVGRAVRRADAGDPVLLARQPPLAGPPRRRDVQALLALGPGAWHLDHHRRRVWPGFASAATPAPSPAGPGGAGRPRHGDQQLQQGLGDDRLPARLADPPRPSVADKLGAMTQYLNSGTADFIQGRRGDGAERGRDAGLGDAGNAAAPGVALGAWPVGGRCPGCG